MSETHTPIICITLRQKVQSRTNCSLIHSSCYLDGFLISLFDSEIIMKAVASPMCFLMIRAFAGCVGQAY